jgi:hypothetical protein
VPSAPMSLLATVLAMGATFLALSLLVQVIQELWKYLTSSRSVSYRKTLIDFLGPHAEHLFHPGVIPDLQVRGPFQFLRRRPTGRLQPMDKDDLVVALERTAAPWVQRALAALRLETSLQRGAAALPSANFLEFLNQAAGPAKGAPGYSTAQDVLEFLRASKVIPDAGQPLDAAGVLLAFRHRFLPHIVRAEQSFTQLVKNYDHAYRRRNLRQTFVFGFVVAFLAEQPLGDVYREARRVPLDQAVAAVEQARAIYQADAGRDTASVRTPAQLRTWADSITAVLQMTDSTRTVAWERLDVNQLRANATKPTFLVGCLLTAILISFGAPFWNDLTGALLRLNRGAVTERPREPGDH